MTSTSFVSLICILLSSLAIVRSSSDVEDLTFPDDFLIGVSTSAHQTEGAWNLSGKSENVWDHLTHNYPEKIIDGSNADVTSDSYHKYKEDVQLVKDLGFNFYRFSLSWSRILPTGFTDNVSKSGVKYYHDLLDELERQGITPFAVIYHWDHPQVLENFGGWLNESMAYVFADYAKFIFREYGHRIKYFVTLNEIYVMCAAGYQSGVFAPGVSNLSSNNMYICAQNMLISHAMIYRTYNEEFREKHHGSIGLLENCFNYYNKDPINDPEAKEIAFAFNCGWIYDPVFKGDYPEIMKERIANVSRARGLDHSLLPPLPQKWIGEIKGSVDFFGLNYYTSMLAEQAPLSQIAIWENDTGIITSFDPGWRSTESRYFTIDPAGLGIMLRRIKDEYGNPPIFILENGIATSNETLRKEFLYSYMKEVLTAIKRDKCNVKAYTIWSLLDFFEWINGYTTHFGLVHVDHNDPNRKRTLKSSTSWLRSVLKNRKLEPYF